MKFDLLVDSAALKSVAEKSISYTSEMNEIVKGLKDVTTTITEAWQGEEANKVKQALDNSITNLAKIANSYHTLETTINEINNKYLDTDDECARLLFKLENR